MKFFVDTADIDEIRDLAATGLLDGVTTNPSLVAKTGRSFADVVKNQVEGERASGILIKTFLTFFQNFKKLL